MLFVLIFHSVALIKRTDASFRSRYFQGFNAAGVACLLPVAISSMEVKQFHSTLVPPIATVAAIFMIIAMQSGSDVSADTVTCISGCMVGLTSVYFLLLVVSWIFSQIPTAQK